MDKQQVAKIVARAIQDAGDAEPTFSVIEMCTLGVLVAWNALLEPIQDAHKIMATMAKALSFESDMQMELDSVEKFLVSFENIRPFGHQFPSRRNYSSVILAQLSNVASV